MKQFILLLLFILVVSFSIAQEKSLTKSGLLIGIEANTLWINSEMSNRWSVRQDVESYDYNYNNYISNSNESFYFAIKPEKFFMNNRLSVSSGIKYLQTNGDLTSDKFFHLRFRKNGNNTEFVRVKKIHEQKHYIGIPLEAKLVVFKYDEVSFYIKAGLDFNVQLATKTNIIFFNSYMNEYAQEVLDEIGISTKSFYSSFYYSIGMRILRLDKVHINTEVILPSPILTSKNSSVSDLDSYAGITISLVVPINLLTK